jgi:hypothetical protein
MSALKERLDAVNQSYVIASETRLSSVVQDERIHRYIMVYFGCDGGFYILGVENEGQLLWASC